MSTNDVPGAVSAHKDVLAMGCWAEHDDGSLIFVMSAEGGKIIYSVFDTAADPIIEYRDSMPEKGFKSTFSWKPTDPKSVKWTWHDKTPFPWDRIIKQGATDGTKYASAHDQLNAAQQVAKSLHLKAETAQREDFEHLQDQVRGVPATTIKNRIQNAISALRGQ
ncbi:MAG: hypothetical protein KJO64_07955 [Bacteroidia bacterium]|nr:hypothetical protein [Bacteroidia bacterium]